MPEDSRWTTTTAPPAGRELPADTSAPTAHPYVEHSGDNDGEHRPPVPRPVRFVGLG
jgi:hypothetical protein